MKRLLIILTTFLLLTTLTVFGQTGFNDFDSTRWTKIDTIEFRSDYSFYAFYKDSTIQKMRVDKIANSSWTAIFDLENNQLSGATFVYHDPGDNKRPPTKYYFSNGKMTSWTDLWGNEQANRESESYKTEETRILAKFNEYFEQAKIHNLKIR